MKLFNFFYLFNNFVAEGLIPDEEFSQYVIPKISELFKSRVLHVRLVLIKYIEFYIHLFDKQILHDFIIPEVCKCILMLELEYYLYKSYLMLFCTFF